MSADQSSNEHEVLERAWATLLERRSLQMSLDEVAAAVGTPPDLISTEYGGSEQLFLRAFEYYAERFVARVHAVLGHRDVREAVRAFVELTVSPESRGSAVLRCCPTPAADGTDPEACPIRRGISDLIQTLDTLLISRLSRPDGQLRLRVASELASKLVIATSSGAAVLVSVQDRRGAHESATNALLDALFAD